MATGSALRIQTQPKDTVQRLSDIDLLLLIPSFIYYATLFAISSVTIQTKYPLALIPFTLFGISWLYTVIKSTLALGSAAYGENLEEETPTTEKLRRIEGLKYYRNNSIFFVYLMISFVYLNSDYLNSLYLHYSDRMSTFIVVLIGSMVYKIVALDIVNSVIRTEGGTGGTRRRGYNLDFDFEAYPISSDSEAEEENVGGQNAVASAGTGAGTLARVGPGRRELLVYTHIVNVNFDDAVDRQEPPPPYSDTDRMELEKPQTPPPKYEELFGE